MIIIRQLNQNDLAQDLPWFIEQPWLTPQTNAEKWQRYLLEQEEKKRIVCVVEYDGTLCGYGSLLFETKYPHFKNANIPEINDIWIMEKYRKQGCGTKLILHLEQLAKTLGYTKIGLGVGLYKDYGAAQKLYTKLGYIPDGNGITYNCKPVVAGNTYPVDDELLMWLVKAI